jgi:hypothetical protein
LVNKIPGSDYFLCVAHSFLCTFQSLRWHCTEQYETLRQRSQIFIRSAICACDVAQKWHNFGSSVEAGVLSLASLCFFVSGNEEPADELDSLHCCDEAGLSDRPPRSHIALWSGQCGIWHSFEQ